jgi:MFS family permease
MAEQSAGYVALLRHNREFRRLWYGQVASELGDWLDSIALYTLLLRLTGSATALAGLLVAQSLPSVLVGLGAGVLIDRLPRKAVLIAADLGRAALVLLFLLARDPSQVWILYVVSFLKFALSSFFEPAREAILPDLVPREELVAANAIGSLTWSAMLAGGAALGGLVAGRLGTDLAFALDSVSFLLSAAFTWAIPVRETHLEGRAETHPLQELREGLSYLLGHRDVGLYALSKALWSLGGGGILVLLPIFGGQVFPLGEGGALSMGLLYAARGVGASLGPLLAHRLGGSSVRFLRRALGPSFLVLGAGYLLLGVSPSLPVAAGALVLAHCGGSVQWVFSTALLQLSTPGRLQGRVFAAELTLLTLVTCLSSWLTGTAADAGCAGPDLRGAWAGIPAPAVAAAARPVQRAAGTDPSGRLAALLRGELQQPRAG